jgi:hypothetical protein
MGKICVRCGQEKAIDLFKSINVCKVCNAVYEVEYRIKNKIKKAKKQKKWADQNREKYRDTLRKYRDNNREQINKDSKVRLKEDVDYKIRRNLRSRLSCAVLRRYKKTSAVRDLGCSVEELRSYLESKFQPGMTWDNYGEWHIDHVRPLSDFDLTNPVQQKEACYYLNLQPLWAIDNLKKSDKYE